MDQIELLRRNELTQGELKNTKRKDKVRGAKETQDTIAGDKSLEQSLKRC